MRAWTLGLLAGVLAAPATGAGISPGGAFFAVCMVPRGSSSHVQGGRFPWDAVLEHGFIRLTTSGGRRLLVLADARSRRVTSDCHRASAAPTLRVDHLAGPWSGTPSSLVFCGSRTSNRLTVVLTRVRDARGRVVGNQVVAGYRRRALVRATVTGQGGKIWFDAGSCLRTTA